MSYKRSHALHLCPFVVLPQAEQLRLFFSGDHTNHPHPHPENVLRSIQHVDVIICYKISYFRF